MPSLSDLNNLFPTKQHALIFVGYMSLFIMQGIFITASKEKSKGYSYNTTTAVLLSEFLKMIAASALFTKETSLMNLFSSVVKHIRVMLLYFVPALMYCLYNNLAFTNLASYDPTTYYLLLQFRVVVTGVIFQIIFKKKLSRKQWLSLFILTFGCIIKQLDASKGSPSQSLVPSFNIQFNVSFGLILVQIFCSCFAGVYNEYLLKGKGEEVPFMVQNVYMYLDSIFCNVLVLAYKGQLGEALTAESISSILQYKVVLVIVDNAAIGIVTALFLRSLNSILKTFASALELMFTAVLCWIIFGIPINIATVVAIAIVSYAILLYAQNPVDNTPKVSKENAEDPSEKV